MEGRPCFCDTTRTAKLLAVLVIPRDEAKVLSFTDNRQDASLQAGHLNDFVQVAQLRAAIVEALRRNPAITFPVLGPEVFDAMELQPEDFLRNPVAPNAPGGGYQ